MHEDAIAKTAAKEGKVPFGIKIAFGMGDIYGGGSFNIVNFLYAFYLANILGIPTAWAAVIMVVARLWDAVSDPLMGAISDNTRTRLGRRKPWFLAGMPLIVVSMIWLWYPPSIPSEALRIAYAAAAYVFYNTVTTMVLVPYMSMAAEVTLDYYERNSLNTVRMMFSLGASLMCAVVPLAIVKAVSSSSGSYSRGYLAMAALMGLVFALPYLAIVFFVPERKDFSASPAAGISLRAMRDAFRLKSFRALVALYLAVFVSLDLITTSFQFYMTYVLERPDDFTAVLALLIVVEILAAMLIPPLVRLSSKRAVTIAGCFMWIGAGLATLLVTPRNPALVYGVAAVMGVSMAFPVVLLNSLFADVTDVGELFFGSRMEGTFSGVQTFVRKCASALANASFMAALGISGFVQPRRVVEGLAERLVFQSQPEALKLFIRATIAFAPAVLLSLGILVVWNWPITSSRHARLLSYLETRRSGGEPDPGLAAEMKTLRDTVF
ncbi:MAG: MFS transporter [Spirochaetes bacterium]|nr:MFS transporter [Spirochaetota bacterium]MBU1082027.1 MFS transporter [Spirochaetota bacterium]